MEPGGGKPDLFATTRSLVSFGDETGIRVPCLTIAHHPDPSRIGDVALLKDLLAGREVRLSRLEPEFRRPSAEGGRPLADPYTSRKPVTLRLGEGGGIVVEGREDGARVELDGVTQALSFQVGRAQLRAGAGVFLGLGGRIILHLGTVALPYVPPVDEQYGMVGRSEALARVRDDIRRVADLDVPVLILGETGSGKELVARAIIKEGRRRDRPEVALNMARIPASTAPSELFGHVRGAFTDAAANKAGAFVDADGGTLFLDEVGETERAVQGMLLRTLETGEVQPVGGSKTRKVDVRILAATDARLGPALEQGRFSEALFNRLAGYVIRLPPLRERREDLPILLERALSRELRAVGAEARWRTDGAAEKCYLGAAVMTRLLTAPWDGNVRQLNRIVQQMVIASWDKPQLQLDEARLTIDGAAASAQGPTAIENDAPAVSSYGPPPPGLSSVELAERERLVQALVRCLGNQTHAAKECDISRSTFVSRLERYAIRRPRTSEG